MVNGAIGVFWLGVAAGFAGGGPTTDAAPTYRPTRDGPPPHAHGVSPDLQAREAPRRAGPALRLPWTCGGVEFCTQGHNGGSHTGFSSWAWDFAHQDGEEIWAASAGTVSHVRTDSAIGGCSDTYAGDANYVTVDHGDGTSILYLHIQPNSSPLSVGDVVEVGDLVARVGETGWACGAHLHMQVQETCGGYYCQALTASFADHGDPSAGVQYESANCPTCPIALDGTETIVDDEDAGCLVRQTNAWWSSYQGHDDHHLYTLAIDAAVDETSARWRFGVDVPGDYLVEAFVPDDQADTTNARYRVHHAGGVDEAVIDQSVDKGWQALGVFEFVGGADEGVVLGDATGESLELSRPIGYDALRFTFMPSAGSTGGDDEGTSEGGGFDSTAGDDDAGVTGGGVSGSGEGTEPPGGTGGGASTSTTGDEPGALPTGFDQVPQPVDCACRSPERSGAGWGWWLGLAAVFGLRRRRAVQSLRP